jgi:hypothetical protein
MRPQGRYSEPDPAYRALGLNGMNLKPYSFRNSGRIAEIRWDNVTTHVVWRRGLNLSAISPKQSDIRNFRFVGAERKEHSRNCIQNVVLDLLRLVFTLTDERVYLGSSCCTTDPAAAAL